jgi:hypothetical protein
MCVGDAGLDPAEARGRAEEILARPEFQPDEPSWLERVVEWVFDRFGDVVGGAADNSVVGLVVLALVIAGLVFLATRLAGRVQRDRPVAASSVEVDHEKGPGHWHAEADRHEAAGRWKEAMGCRYRALVAELAERDAIDGLPARTTGELRAQVSAGCPAAGAPFGEASDLFDQVWYAGAPAGPEQSRELATLTHDAVEATR